MEEFLKKVPLFANLPDGDLKNLASIVKKVKIKAGQTLFDEGDPGDSAYIIESGQIEITKISDGKEVLLARVGPGEVIGEMALLDEAPRMASAKANTDTTLLAINQQQLDELLNSSPSATRAMLYTITNRWRETEALLLQSEKMAQLGTLTAGMAHELNNPASAVRRGASQIKDTYSLFQELHFSINRTKPEGIQLKAMISLDGQARDSASHPIEIVSLSRSDKELKLESILDTYGLENAWQVAPSLVSLGIEEERLNEIASKIPSSNLGDFIRWLDSSFSIYGLMQEISQSARHISNVVKALKTYTYQDSASIQDVDIHQTIEETLILMKNVIGHNITVIKKFDADLPSIQGYQSELGPVWRNIIRNAVDAIEDDGNIIIRTKHVHENVLIEFEDNGSGIPDDIQDKIFDPFFTTKPPGEGAGLGLNISYNIINQKHHGEIRVVSTPGKTIFTVLLPVKLEEGEGVIKPTSAIQRSGDKTIMNILTKVKNIAVVGISSRDNRPANFVPAYLINQGYHIFPINPTIENVLGQKAYPNLKSINESIDLVLIFRRSEAIPEIVDEAIEIGAKVIWMQEGIINEKAAFKAREAGLSVIMDSCMRKQHLRLVQEDNDDD